MKPILVLVLLLASCAPEVRAFDKDCNNCAEVAYPIIPEVVEPQRETNPPITCPPAPPDPFAECFDCSLHACQLNTVAPELTALCGMECGVEYTPQPLVPHGLVLKFCGADFPAAACAPFGPPVLNTDVGAYACDPSANILPACSVDEDCPLHAFDECHESHCFGGSCEYYSKPGSPCAGGTCGTYGCGF